MSINMLFTTAEPFRGKVRDLIAKSRLIFMASLAAGRHGSLPLCCKH